mmetsp:Transcript_4014/g.7734  ORF Transcript_4014/g.7734 Transcript_4014/m.7734 type:complete len:101 (+) Transcript_4014:76-378(+)
MASASVTAEKPMNQLYLPGEVQKHVIFATQEFRMLERRMDAYHFPELPEPYSSTLDSKKPSRNSLVQPHLSVCSTIASSHLYHAPPRLISVFVEIYTVST